MDTTSKTCKDCGTQFPATAEFFYGNGTGLLPRCKTCHKAYCTRWYQQNPDRAKVLRNRATKKYKAKHPDRIAKSRSKPEYKQRKSEWSKKDRKENPEKHKALDANNRFLRKSRLAGTPGRLSASIVKKQLQLQDGKCWWCGCALIEYHVDHVIPISKGGTNTPQNIVCACPSCNLRKHAKLPHEFAGRLF